MKNIFLRLSFAALASCFLANFALAKDTKEQINIITSIKPIYSIVYNIAGSNKGLDFIIKDNQSPHEAILKPSQKRKINDADIIFYIGDDFEISMSKAIPKSAKKVILFDAKGIKKIKYEDRHGKHDDHDEEEHHDDKDDDKHAHKDDNHDKDDDHDDEHGHHGHGIYDKHIWLSITNAKVIAKVIAAELGAIYPQNKDIYNKNLQEFMLKVDKLDKDIKTTLKGTQEIPFAVFHDAFAYFEDRYGLENIGAILKDEHMPPSAKHIKEMKEEIKEERAVCVFTQPQFSKKSLDTIKEGTNIKVAVLDQLGAGLPNDKELYFKLMNNLAKSISSCLKGQ